MKVKICKTCGAENSPANIECCECMGDISGIKPVEKTESVEKSGPEQNVAAPSATVREVKKPRLILVAISAARNGDLLPVSDGDVLGREHVGKDLFAVYDKVSRRHAKIACSRVEWTIEDLDSTNGTYINGKKLAPGQKYPLLAKDILALSKSCEFLVEIGEYL